MEIPEGPYGPQKWPITGVPLPSAPAALAALCSQERPGHGRETAQRIDWICTWLLPETLSGLPVPVPPRLLAQAIEPGPCC